ncbi:MAG: urease accessory protein UreD [Pseudomonadota bacterium]
MDVAETLAPEHVSPASGHWQARLLLRFSDDNGVTRLTDRSHVGPLRVQKPLYPEGADVCHAIIVHPPGGVVGGDELTVEAHVQMAAHALVTTPGAAKWYKANGKVSTQTIHIQVDADAGMEWLPQETIFFDAADVQLMQSISLAKGARYISAEILCFGRIASGETFSTGKIAQHTVIRREGKLIWFEQGALAGGSAAMNSALGLNGNSVSATLIAAGGTVPTTVINALRADADLVLNGAGSFGVTQLHGLVVVRYLGNASETARALMLLAWRHLRIEVMGRDAVELRIWNT